MKVLLVLPAADHLRVGAEGRSVPRRKMLRLGMLSLTTVAALTPARERRRLADRFMVFVCSAAERLIRVRLGTPGRSRGGESHRKA